MKEKTKASIIREKIFSFAETMIISLFSVTLVFVFLLRVTTITGISMAETLSEGDRVIMTAWYGTPKQGDVVVINAEHAVTMNDSGELVASKGINKYIVKRIIAVPGQKVDFDFHKGTVYIDDKVYDEPYITGLTHLDEGAFTGHYPLTVPDGYVFVMGDNRRDSQDSRSYRIGLIPEEDIVGKILMRVYPLKDLGLID
jgi:signal peptidase I